MAVLDISFTNFESANPAKAGYVLFVYAHMVRDFTTFCITVNIRFPIVGCSGKKILIFTKVIVIPKISSILSLMHILIIVRFIRFKLLSALQTLDYPMSDSVP